MIAVSVTAEAVVVGSGAIDRLRVDGATEWSMVAADTVIAGVQDALEGFLLRWRDAILDLGLECLDGIPAPGDECDGAHFWMLESGHWRSIRSELRLTMVGCWSACTLSWDTVPPSGLKSARWNSVALVFHSSVDEAVRVSSAPSSCTVAQLSTSAGKAVVAVPVFGCANGL